MPVIQKLYENTMVGDPPKITVLFTLGVNGAPPAWSITPDSLTMHGNGQIQFVLDSASSAGTSFVGFAIKATSPNPNRAPAKSGSACTPQVSIPWTGRRGKGPSVSSTRRAFPPSSATSSKAVRWVLGGLRQPWRRGASPR